MIPSIWQAVTSGTCLFQKLFIVNVPVVFIPMTTSYIVIFLGILGVINDGINFTEDSNLKE